MPKSFVVILVTYGAVVLTVIGFLGWVIVKVMQHFQII